jgi:hypothetical protein
MAVGEWDERQLCPDGACVGVIGPDGTCKVCGRAAPNWGDERKRGLIDPPDDEDAAEASADSTLVSDDDEDDDDLDDDEDSDDEDDDEDYDDEDDAEPDDGNGAMQTAPATTAAPVEWTARQLCSDGACIGVIGEDGRCKVCGKRPTGAAEPPTLAAEPAVGLDPAPCSDATCTGMAGPEGICTVCGKVVA